MASALRHKTGLPAKGPGEAKKELPENGQVC